MVRPGNGGTGRIERKMTNLFFHGAGEHLNALHVDGAFDAFFELFVLAPLPTNANETTTAGENDEQCCHTDADHAPVWNCTHK